MRKQTSGTIVNRSHDGRQTAVFLEINLKDNENNEITTRFFVYAWLTLDRSQESILVGRIGKGSTACGSKGEGHLALWAEGSRCAV